MNKTNVYIGGKGFTLIELLAVIVILAIIATIATPIVLNIIKDAKKSSNIRSAENYIHSLELSLVNNQLTNLNLSDGFYSIDEIEVNVDGKKPTQGYVQIEKGNVVKYNVMIDNQEIDSIKDYDIWTDNTNVNLEKSSDGYYHVTSSNDLYKFSAMVNSGTSFEGETIILDTNLDLNGKNKEWIPIGSEATPFSGIFEGNNHVIKNLKINGSGDYTGLFGYIISDNYSSINNLIVINSNVSGVIKTGTIAGLISDNGNLNNCSVYNSYVYATGKTIGGIVGGIRGTKSNSLNFLKTINTYIEGIYNVGGIVGQMEYTSGIYNSYVDSMSKIKANGITLEKFDFLASNSGGISGSIWDTSSINNCISNATINSLGSHVGGITGQAATGTYINNSYSYSKITATQYVGGLVGNVNKSTILNSIANAIITSTTSNNIGSFIGFQNDSTITNCSSNSTVNGVLIEKTY